ncbi:hypothetical protein F5144DRAFT_572823 [Chaetomium tenue]|uniref:Uncharacterized protein n=1 Tax=Chaetomium tenue TaxID=1854479 RepID=A0ACB7PCV1_9PEZI|nr:hypothetical protein F5144DRAFT_572823 [Chaetomium globosum]
MSDMFDYMYPPERYLRARATASDSSDAGNFDISSVRLRVGAPPPMGLPLNNQWDARCKLIADELGRGVLESETKKILSAEGVTDVISVELTSRDVEYTYRETHPTIFIVARWEDGCSDLWEAVVRKVKKLVDSKRLTSEKLGDIDIAVEMIAEEFTLKKYMSGIPEEILAEGLERDWPGIKSRVIEILDSHSATKERMSMITLCRLGFSPRDSENQETVYVSIEYGSDESEWPPIIEEIKQYLKEVDYAQLHVQFEYGISMHF